MRSASYHHGTGYFIGGGCVVTAAALVDRDSTCQVHPLDREEWHAGHIVWRADDDTLALLDLRDPELRRFSNAWLGRLDTTAQVRCRILGFSGFTAARDDRRAIVDVEQLSGEIQALTGSSERLTVRVGSTTPRLGVFPDLMSGAPVFVGTLLVGVVAGRERIDEPRGVWALAPVTDPRFLEALRTAFGVELAISPVTSPSLSPKAAAEHTEELPGVEATYELAGGFSSDAVDPMRGIPLERDHLGMRPYVTMLATVIADRRTAMPLSVGLFGEWGSGKSYFMGLLRQQVNQLSESGRSHYLGNIAQIGFNAWHYAHTNLWASLGDEIFEQLAGPRASVDEQRDKLRAKLAETLQRRRELQAATAQAQQETARLSAAIEKASDDKRRSTRALVAAAARSETVQDQLDEAFKQLGVNDEAEQGRLLADELRTSAPDFDALCHLATGRRARALAALAAVGLLLLAAGALVGDELGRLLAGGGLASVLGLLGAALTVAARMRSGLRLLSQAASEITADIEAHPGRAVADQLNVLRRAEADERILQAQLDEVVGHVGELGRELAALSPGHRLYRFVSDRADSDRYGQHLGLISTVRKDFEQLTELMDEWRKHPGSDPHAPRAIDRIVLYIDDLDRCSTRQVVEVLQAVHLLLALELFVVVVGVDPRWLLRSLQREYPDQLVGDGPDTHGWDASPQDYLEKIFNIPFALPAMSPDTFRVLLDGLTSEDELVDDRAAHADASSPGEPGASASLPASTASPSAARDRGAGTDAHAPAVADIPIEPESVIASIMRGEPDIEVRQLTDAELLLLASLAPLVQTPREAKRLINLYRMVRSATSLSPARGLPRR